MEQTAKPIRKRMFVGQSVWACCIGCPWWPAYLWDCNDPVDVSIPSGCYVIKYASGKYGFAADHNLKPLDEMSLKTVLGMDFENKFKLEISKDYKHISTNSLLTNRVATTRPKLMVNICKKTRGKEEQIEVVVGVKKRKRNIAEDKEVDDSEDEEMYDSEDEAQMTIDCIPERFVDANELMNILQVYSNKGFLGILEFFGMTFANLKFSLKSIDLKDESTIAYQIYQLNSTMEEGLMQYLSNFLTTFSIQFKKEFLYHTPETDYLTYLERQYDEAKAMAEKLYRLSPEAQHKLLRTCTPSLFLPLFKIKNLIENETHMVEMTYQEYVIMIFKQLHIFSNNRNQSIVFKTSEPLESDSLKLSLNIMNKKWIENTPRMQPDFALVRYHKEYKHYFLIGEFENSDIKATNAEEFLCLHKDTIKILLEGRSVLKDIATKATSEKLKAEIKENLMVTLFLADTSGKVVILKMRPIFHQIMDSLLGVYFEFSYSRLLNLFEMKDACIVLSEIDNCVEVACKFSYDIDETNTITSLCATPMTLKSKSEIAKLITIPVEKGDFSLVFFDSDDETKLFNKLAEEFPRLSVRKGKIVPIVEIDTIPILFSINFSGDIKMYGSRTMNVCENPIVACYPIQYCKKDVRFQIIYLENPPLDCDTLNC